MDVGSERDPPGLRSAEICMTATVAAISGLADWLAEILRGREVPEDVAFSVRLCLEEALTNVMNHAYETPGEATVSVVFTDTGEELAFEIVDSGRRFDPLSVETGPVTGDIAGIEPGGQGLHLIRSFSGRLEYERRDGLNRFRMFFDAPSAGGDDPEAT